MDKKYAQQLLLKVTKDYSVVAENFSRARSEIWPEMETLILKYIDEKDKVLDLGCGNGRFFSSISKRNASYIGLDSSKELIEIAKKKYPQVDFYVGDALKNPWPEDSFDKIISVAVLHHIPSHFLRAKFIQECRRVLEPGGLLIITVWNLWDKPKKRKEIFKNLALRIVKKTKLDFKDLNVDWFGVKNCYVHCFTSSELKNLVIRNGFKLIESGKIELKNKKTLSNIFIIAEKCGYAVDKN